MGLFSTSKSKTVKNTTNNVLNFGMAGDGAEDNSKGKTQIGSASVQGDMNVNTTIVETDHGSVDKACSLGSQALNLAEETNGNMLEVGEKALSFGANIFDKATDSQKDMLVATQDSMSEAYQASTSAIKSFASSALGNMNNDDRKMLYIVGGILVIGVVAMAYVGDKK